jgi:hypothetical protein
MGNTAFHGGLDCRKLCHRPQGFKRLNKGSRVSPDPQTAAAQRPAQSGKANAGRAGNEGFQFMSVQRQTQWVIPRRSAPQKRRAPSPAGLMARRKDAP